METLCGSLVSRLRESVPACAVRVHAVSVDCDEILVYYACRDLLRVGLYYNAGGVRLRFWSDPKITYLDLSEWDVDDTLTRFERTVRSLEPRCGSAAVNGCQD